MVRSSPQRTQQRKTPRRRSYTRLVQVILIGTPPLLVALSQVIKTVHDVGWW